MLPMPFNDPDTYPGHSGVDFGQPMWTPVPASGSGRIYGHAYNDRCGYGLWVSYDGYPDILYCHLPEGGWRAEAGARISEGDIIAYVGSTGNSSGPHLHVEVENHATTDGFWQFFDPNRVVGQGGGGTQFPARERYGADWVVAAQQKLQRLGYDIGGSGADGYDGADTQNAVEQLQARGALEQDGIYGPDANALADRLLATKNGHRAFPLPAGYYFGPADGPVESVSGFYSYRDDLRAWQQQMADRDWTIEVDGLYGPGTGDVAEAFQKEKGLTADRLIGPATWDAAWEAPVTPPDGGGTPTPEPAPGRNATKDPGSLIPPRPTTDIQAFLGVPQTGVWDQATSDTVAQFQTAREIDVDRVWGITCDGLAFPPEGNHGLGADWSFARPAADKLRRQGIVPVGRYLWNPKYEDGRTNKGISGAEYGEHVADGRQPFFYFEESADDPILGFDEGVRQAKAAEVHRIREGLPALRINFPADRQILDSEIPALLDGLRGAASVVGLERTGIYGGYSVVKAAFDAGVISGAVQTYAWSLDANGHIQWDPRAQLRQWSNGQWGNSIDFIWAMAEEFGQHPAKPTPEPDTVVVNRAQLQGVVDELSSMLNG